MLLERDELQRIWLLSMLPMHQANGWIRGRAFVWRTLQLARSLARPPCCALPSSLNLDTTHLRDIQLECLAVANHLHTENNQSMQASVNAVQV